MTRRTTTTAMTTLLIFLAIMVPAAAAEPQPGASDENAAQLQPLQNERLKVLTQLVDVLASQYKLGIGDFAEVFSAENELCNALLDSTDDPDKRLVLLREQLDKVNRLVEMTQGRVKAGIAGQADLLRAKALYLGVKIKLLRERSRKRPPTPTPAGKHR